MRNRSQLHFRRLGSVSLLLSLTLLFALLVRGVPAHAENGEFILPVFETSDVHGYIADTSGNAYEYRVAYIADKVRDERSADGTYRKERAVLLDGGDIFQGNTASNFLKGHSLSAAYQLMDYDAVTIGNHEFDWGIETVIDEDGTMLDYQLENEVEENTVPVVASNIYKDRKPVTFAKPYVILNKEAVNASGEVLPVRIAVIGYTDDYSSSIMQTRFTGAGFRVIGGYQEARRIASELESNGEADATILLGHSAAEETAYGIGAGSAIDLVLGGHTHVNESGVTSFGLPFMQPAANASAYAYTTLRFQKNGSGKAEFTGTGAVQPIGVSDHPSKLVPNEKNQNELDPAIVKLTDFVVGEISELLDAKIGFITHAALKSESLPGSGGRSTSGGNWMASIIQRSANAEIGFVNNGGIRTSFALDGERRIITVSDVYTMFPFSNRIFCYEITYEELLELFRYAVSAGESLFSRMVGIDCYISDNNVQALVKDGKAIYLNGEWKNGWPEKKVTVGVSEFVATTDRPGNGLSNPLVAWQNTPRLVSSDVIDLEGAIHVLDEEAEKNHWELTVDVTAHYLTSEYRDPSWTKEDGDAESEPASVIEPVTSEAGESGGESMPLPERDLPEGESSAGPLLWLVPVLIGSAVLLAGAVVLAVFLVRKKRKKTAEKTG